MGLIQASRAGGGGGGGITIAGFENQQENITENFTASSLVFALVETPVDAAAITIDYNGQRLKKDVAWSFDSGTNSVTILFGDAYVTDYPTGVFFQIVYAYS